MAHTQPDITVTIEEWLNKSFAGQVALWGMAHLREPEFITSFTLWAVKLAARILEPLLLVCAVYLMISMGVPSLMQPGMHDFSMSTLTGAPDVILPGGFATVRDRFIKKSYISGSLMVIFLTAMAVLTGYANADVFHVIKLEKDQITQLLFWRSMIALAYSTTVIITLLTGLAHREQTVHLPNVQAQIDALQQSFTEQQRTQSEQNVRLITDLLNTTNRSFAQVAEQFRSLGISFNEQIHSVTEQIVALKYSLDEQNERIDRNLATENEAVLSEPEQHTITALAPILQTLEQYMQALAMLPEMQSQLGQIEQSTRLHVHTMVEEVTILKTTVLEQTKALPKLLERVVTVQPSHRVEGSLSNIRQLPRPNRSEPGPNTETNTPDKGSFVRQCLRDDPNIRNSEIQRKASEHNLTISPGYISDIRKAFAGLTEHVDAESEAQ